jgi:hypothetical protein
MLEPISVDRRMLVYRLVMASSVIVLPLFGTTPLRRLVLSLAYGWVGRCMIRPLRMIAWRDATASFQRSRAAQDEHLIPVASPPVARSGPAARRS